MRTRQGTKNVVAQFIERRLTTIPSFSKGGLGRIMNNPPIISPNPSLEKRGNKGISPFSKGGNSGSTTTPDGFGKLTTGESGNYTAKAQRHKACSGGSLIEILIAIFILAIIFTSYGSTFLISRYTVRKTEVEKEAQNMARETVEELSNYVMHDTSTVLIPGLRLPDNRAGDTKWALEHGSTHYIDLPAGHPLLGNPLTGAVTRYYYVEDTGDGGKKVSVTVEWAEKRMPGME